MRQKIQVFKETTQMKKQIFLTMITALGLKSNINSVGLMDTDFDSEVLFVLTYLYLKDTKKYRNAVFELLINNILSLLHNAERHLLDFPYRRCSEE
ncbi:MAG: hypothetical protein ACJA1N_001728 [Saprospiraceae bacterium]